MAESQNKEAPDDEELQSRDIAKTEEITDRKCPSCGGVMEFDPKSQMLSCPYCGNQVKIENEKMDFEAQELDFYSAEADASCDWGLSTKTILCKSCGARTIYDANIISSSCPYCGSNQVVEETDARVMAPGGVVPFSLDDKKASESFKNWLGHKFYCPKLAKDSAKPKSFTGVYMPYWTFDTNTRSDYHGYYGVSRIVRDREGKTRTVIDWHPTAGRYGLFFDDFLVCGSTGSNRSMVEGLEPFDTLRAKEYRPEYMAGFRAEHYTVKMKDAWEEAKDKMQRILQNKVESQIKAEHGADNVRGVHLHTSYGNITYKYLLLPIWISSFKYKDKIYHFMINGQTGKVSGDSPISAVKVALTILAVLLLILIVWYLSK